MKKLLILTVFFVIFGCAHPQPKMGWIGLQNQTEAQFYQDKYECEVQVGQVMGPPPNPNPSTYIPPLIMGNRPLTMADVYRPPDPGLIALAGDAMRRNNMITSCLQAKGYKLREVGKGVNNRESHAQPVPSTLEPIRATYPRYRIDDKMQRISIIGSGPKSEEIQSVLTKLFMEKSDIKIIDPGNLQSIFGGKMIEYGTTGITPDQAQALSQMFQIDHLLLFDIRVAPHSDYRYGGRQSTAISLKIVNTINGEMLFQTSSNVGGRYEDPRKYGYSQINEMSPLLNAAFGPVAHELRYALGDVSLGIFFENVGSNKILVLMVDSVAYRAGFQKGDLIVGANETRISSQSELSEFFRNNKTKQGDEVTFKIERGGQVMERKVRFPIIPIRIEKEKESPTDQPEKTKLL